MDASLWLHLFSVEINISDIHMESRKVAVYIKHTLIYVEKDRTGRKEQGQDRRRVKYALFVGI